MKLAEVHAYFVPWCCW